MRNVGADPADSISSAVWKEGTEGEIRKELLSSSAEVRSILIQYQKPMASGRTGHVKVRWVYLPTAVVEEESCAGHAMCGRRRCRSDRMPQWVRATRPTELLITDAHASTLQFAL